MAGNFFRPKGSSPRQETSLEVRVSEVVQSSMASFLRTHGERTRLGLFIDGANLYTTMRKLRWDMDYGKLLNFWNERGSVIYAGYYTAVLQNREDNNIQSLLDWLSYHGWSVVTKPAREYTNDQGVKWIKGNMDMEMAMDALVQAKHLDHVILGTGDGDFKVLVYELQRMGVTVTVMSSLFKTDLTSPICSDAIRRQANSFMKIEDYKDQLRKS